MKNIHQTASLTVLMSLPLHITIIIMVGVSTSNPVPQFVFPEQEQQKQKYLPGEGRDAIQSCLEQDYSMPFFNETDAQVQAVFCTMPIFELCYITLFILYLFAPFQNYSLSAMSC